MAIDYYLLKNANTSGGVSYRPVAQTSASLPLEHFAVQLAAETGQKAEEILKTLLAVGPKLGATLANGHDIDWTDLGLFKSNITDASVANPSDQLPITARGDVAFTPRGAFKAQLEGASFHRIEPPSHAPQWESVTAPFGSLTTLGARDIVEIRGQNLQFNNDPTTREEGIYLRPTGGITLVPAPKVSVHTPQKINFQIPDGIMPGSYTLELHTRGPKFIAASAPLQVFVWNGLLTVI